VHLSAATVWIGGLVQLVAVVWPLAPDARRAAFLRFSRLATVCIALILSAGIYLSILRLPHVHDLWTAGYGRVLLVKLALVALALTWGAVHHFVVRPVLERGDEPGPLFARLPRSLAGESAVAMAILLVAAVLVDSKPPPRPVSSPPTAARSRP
jgi:putative copper export protein